MPSASAEPERTSYAYDRRRSLKIIFFFSYHFLEFLAWEFGLRVLFGEIFVARGREKRLRRMAHRFRQLAVEMGGVMIKLGQFISTRVDILPISVIKELERLQDEVDPVPFDAIEKVMQAELGELMTDFDTIDVVPVAAASLGQVYRVRLDGVQVVLKVQRPGIHTKVATDLAALRVVAGLAMKFGFISRRADVPALLEEFSAVLWEELDYYAEANNAERFAAMFADKPGVYVPKVYRKYSGRQVITLEDVSAIKINDYARLEAEGVDRTEVARRLLDTYLTQIFHERVFHADPHPGNIFIRPFEDEKYVKNNGHRTYIIGRPFELIFVDYGMVGRLTPQLVETLRQTLIAGGLRDARRVVECYEQLGLLIPGADQERIINATQKAFDLVWGLNMTELGKLPPEEYIRFGREFRDILFSVPFRIPQNLIYFGRCAGILSGMCTGLDPNFDPWSEVQPYVRLLIEGGSLHEEEPPQRIWEKWQDFLTTDNLKALFTEDNLELALEAGSEYLIRAAQLPVRVEEILHKAEIGELETRMKLGHELEQRLARIEAQNRQIIWSVVFAAVSISSAIMLRGRKQ